MSNIPNIITIDKTIVENMEHYTYLGYTIKLGKENQHADVAQRFQLSWTAFDKLYAEE